MNSTAAAAIIAYTEACAACQRVFPCRLESDKDPLCHTCMAIFQGADGDSDRLSLLQVSFFLPSFSDIMLLSL